MWAKLKKLFREKGQQEETVSCQFAIEMNASPELTRRVWKSYGATTIIFEYLGQKEAHKFQGADKWMYKRGVCRVFFRVTLREVLRYFVRHRTGRVIRYDPRDGAFSSREVVPGWEWLSNLSRLVKISLSTTRVL